MLQSLGHVTLRCADFARTEAFYCGLLGLRKGPRPAIPVPGHWYYIGESAVLHILPRLADTVEAAAGVVDHFALNAQQLPAYEARLRAAGQPFKCVRLADTEVWQLFLTDPDGARVELCFACEGQATQIS
jgi:catechol 2,3-dioxygenase-like lactoylglutathione lyase family enzyme